MPIQGKYIDASRVLRSDAPCQSEEKHDAQHDQSSSNVKGVQANERVVCRSKEIRGNSQPVFVDQAVPFLARAVQKEGAKSDREQPREQKCGASSAFQKLSRKVDRQTAGQQTDRIEDRRFQHFARSRS